MPREQLKQRLRIRPARLSAIRIAPPVLDIAALIIPGHAAPFQPTSTTPR